MNATADCYVYRWNSIDYHLQTNNKDNSLLTDFGLKEFSVSSEKEQVRRYRRYLYDAGSIDRPDKGKCQIIDPRVLYQEKKKDSNYQKQPFALPHPIFYRFPIIGSKEFVSRNYERFKHLFMSKHKKKPKPIPIPINGLSEMYSLKRLSEVI